MLADRGLPTLVPPHTSTFSRRPSPESRDNVFEEASCSSSLKARQPPQPPLSPRSGKTPGIILTMVEGVEEETTAEVIAVCERPGSSSGGHIRPSRRSRHHQHRNSQTHRQQNPQRSPSITRMRRNGSNQKLREPLMNGGSSGVSRSQSMRTARRPQSVDPSHRFRHRISSIPTDMTLNSDLLDPQRLASNQSLPLPGDEADFLRLRNFAVTPKGVINRGDSFRSKSRSAHSVSSVGSGGHLPVQRFASDDSRLLKAVAAAAAVARASTSAEEITIVKDLLTPEPDVVLGAASSVVEPETKLLRYRVLVIGPPDVGKTSLTRQFMTSEYICSYDGSIDEENDKSVQVILNGEESEMVFLEHTYIEDPNINLAAMYGPDAYLVVYSVTNKRSLQTAKDIIKVAKKNDPNIETKAIILVGNKTDLARHRMLSADDARTLAIEEGSKFIETSAGINHHVDELLVGILSQIRLKLSSAERLLRKRESVSLDSSGKIRNSGKCAGCAGCRAKGILKRILKKACSRSKSCDNLHVL